jgi:RNA polymerase sigma-70 factor, ECF subfamily
MNESTDTEILPADPSHWVNEHGDYLFRYALSRVRRVELAEDLVQETFLGALRNRHQFAGTSSEKTWLISILKRKIVDHLRRQHREQPASNFADEAWMDDLFDRTGHWKSGPAKWTNMSTALENAEFWKTFGQCVSALPEPLAAVFSLREVEEVPSAVVCATLEISQSNYHVMMHRARLRLWRCMSARWFGGEK